MRRIICLLALTLAMASPAFAVTRVNVQRLELLLAEYQGQPDGKVATEIATLELTERLSLARLGRLQTEFPGHRCHDALTQLADEAAFLDLPADDVLSNAAPDQKNQTEIIAGAVEFVNRTFSRLPNFYATRKTVHYEDTPPRQTTSQMDAPPVGRGRFNGVSGPGGMGGVSTQVSGYVPMHTAGNYSVSISYRDGSELVNSKKVDITQQAQTTGGLTTTGEFGPILDLVLDDAIKGKLAWGYWYQDANAQPSDSKDANAPNPRGLQAVFRYWVADGQSNYVVGIPTGKQIDRVFPAYHGEIAIDPVSGDVLRITILANLAPRYERMDFDTVVEYAAVPIGGTTYTCPVKGVVISKTPIDFSASNPDKLAPIQTQMNDVTFTDYHLFRSESRIIPVETGSPDAQPETPPTAPPQ